MKILIVNADDFGRSAGINRGVARAHEDGVVTSASLMVRGAKAEEAAAYARTHPELSVGLHIDLGEWVFRDGDWIQLAAPASPVEDEIGYQLELFTHLVGRTPTHLDSHQHVHRDEPARSFALEIASTLGVPLRGMDDRIAYCGSFYGQTTKGEPLHDAITVDALVRLLAGLPPGVTEIGCHPGIGTEGDSPYGRERVIEVAALCDQRVKEAIDANGLELSAFSGIARKSP